MKNKTIGYLILTSISCSLIATMLIDEALADLLYSIAGFGFMVFGAFGAYRLIKE